MNLAWQKKEAFSFPFFTAAEKYLILPILTTYRWDKNYLSHLTTLNIFLLKKKKNYLNFNYFAPLKFKHLTRF